MLNGWSIVIAVIIIIIFIGSSSGTSSPAPHLLAGAHVPLDDGAVLVAGDHVLVQWPPQHRQRLGVVRCHLRLHNGGG